MSNESAMLIEGFRRACNNDLEVIEMLYQNNSKNILIFYHMEQALEKYLKFDLIQTSQKGLNYDQLRKKFGHKIEYLNFMLISELCDTYINEYSKVESVNKTTDYQDFVVLLNSFKDTVKTKSDSIKYHHVENIKNYKEFVNDIYTLFEISKSQENLKKLKPVSIITVSTYLSCCLYNMDMISRYPLKEGFNLKNFDFLERDFDSVNQIYEMLQFFIYEVNSPH
jgi:hypothetical protein